MEQEGVEGEVDVKWKKVKRKKKTEDFEKGKEVKGSVGRKQEVRGKRI